MLVCVCARVLPEGLSWLQLSRVGSALCFSSWFTICIYEKQKTHSHMRTLERSSKRMPKIVEDVGHILAADCLRSHPSESSEPMNPHAHTHTRTHSCTFGCGFWNYLLFSFIYLFSWKRCTAPWRMLQHLKVLSKAPSNRFNINQKSLPSKGI